VDGPIRRTRRQWVVGGNRRGPWQDRREGHDQADRGGQGGSRVSLGHVYPPGIAAGNARNRNAAIWPRVTLAAGQNRLVVHPAVIPPSYRLSMSASWVEPSSSMKWSGSAGGGSPKARTRKLAIWARVTGWRGQYRPAEQPPVIPAEARRLTLPSPVRLLSSVKKSWSVAGRCIARSMNIAIWMRFTAFPVQNMSRSQPPVMPRS